jgi:hypothetical protein
VLSSYIDVYIMICVNGIASLCPELGLNYLAMLDVAIDVAKGMEHLHSLSTLHTDLKVWAPRHILKS